MSDFLWHEYKQTMCYFIVQFIEMLVSEYSYKYYVYVYYYYNYYIYFFLTYCHKIDILVLYGAALLNVNNVVVIIKI